MTRVHAFGDDALGDLDAVGLVARIQAREVSVAEVVEAAIARVERVDPQLNAVAHAAFDRARARRRGTRAAASSPACRPSSRTTSTSRACRPSRAPTPTPPGRSRRDGDFARMFLATGLLPLGKTRLSEYGFSAVGRAPAARARCAAPWDTEHTAGASSAGSAALVAAGAVPIAHANDGGGSIRIPARSTAWSVSSRPATGWPRTS